MKSTEKSQKLESSYNICVIDIGSPKLGNIGWSFIQVNNCQKEYQGTSLDKLISLIHETNRLDPLLLGLEAPLFVPIREELKLATKSRKGEGSRPWSAGAGAQVLVINLPIMVYLFTRIKKKLDDIEFLIDKESFGSRQKQVLLFEALVSGSNKGQSHVEDAQIMANYCLSFSRKKQLPIDILEKEEGVQFFNIASAALLRSGLINSIEYLDKPSPIYKPTLI